MRYVITTWFCWLLESLHTPRTKAMTPSAIACPNCQVRFQAAAPADRDKAFPCPKCGHTVLVRGTAVAGSSGQKTLLLVLIGAVLLVGSAIIAALFMTRQQPGSDKIAEVPAAKPVQTL